MSPQSHFEFIDYSGAASGRSRVSPEARHRARVVVMQDYLKKTRSLQRELTKPQQMGLMKQRTTKFRLRPATPKISPATTPGQHSADDTENESQWHHVPRPSALMNQLFLSIDASSRETRALIDYYLHSYWTNSLAVNPRGEWTIMTLADPAMVHAKLSLVALHRADRGQGGLSPEHIYHRGQAFSLITKRLADRSAEISESSIGSIALLVSLDDHSQWFEASKNTHLLAVAALVKERGGINSPSINDPLRRVLCWVDLLHATLSEQKPLFGMARVVSTASVGELRSARDGKLLQRHRQQHLMTQSPTLTHLFDLLEDLSTLLHTKSRLTPHSSRTQRTAFSDSLYTLEASLAHLTDLASPNDIDDPWASSDALSAFRDAALICSYARLREQNSLFIFGRLARRLQAYVSPLLHASRYNKGVLGASVGADVLLWMLVMGWKATILSRGDSRWFSVRALETALRYGVGDRLLSDGTEADTATPLSTSSLSLSLWDGGLLFLGLDASDMGQLRREMRGWVDLAHSSGNKATSL